MKVSPQLFAFGCSFTNYLWPTWADILGKHFETYYNYGKQGAGNQFIFNSIVEANLKHCFTPQDTVAIMWTNVSREDRYVNGEWLTPGNIYTQKLYDKTFVKKFADTRGYYIRDLALIWTADQLLEKIGCKVIHFSMVDITNPVQWDHEDYSEEIDDLIVYYQPVLTKILPSVHSTVFNNDWQSRPNNASSETLSEVLPRVLDRQRWVSWYENIRDPSWPDCNYEDDFINLPEYIQKECYEKFNYDAGQRITKYNKKSISSQDNYKNVQLNPKQRDDMHPTPAEHLEYLEYVLPDFDFDNSTKIWTQEVNNLVQSAQDYSSIWVPNIPKRW